WPEGAQPSPLHRAPPTALLVGNAATTQVLRARGDKTGVDALSQAAQAASRRPQGVSGPCPHPRRLAARQESAVGSAPRPSAGGCHPVREAVLGQGVCKAGCARPGVLRCWPAAGRPHSSRRHAPQGP
uniref:Uncharacterized protein n=1 Tax=Sciurus vulgaris TaxID=55149 RepID=A0A8D2DJ40_SCIVU